MQRLTRLLLALTLIALSTFAVSAQESSETGTASAKQKAKQERIDEYLRKKEQRLADKQSRRESEEQPQTEETAAPEQGKGAGRLPRGLAAVQSAVRASSIGQDPTVQHYLDLIDRQEASAYELAAFANFVADSGLRAEAVVYYSVAVDLESGDPVLWINLGTLYRQLGELQPAANAYGRALRLDSNNALAHYNMGAIYDAQGKYEDAIQAYTVALTLDPSLGDPKTNPQAANNTRLLAVKLMLYQQQTGTLGTPLVPIPEDKLAEKPKAPAPPEED